MVILPNQIFFFVTVFVVRMLSAVGSSLAGSVPTVLLRWDFLGLFIKL